MVRFVGAISPTLFLSALISESLRLNNFAVMPSKLRDCSTVVEYCLVQAFNLTTFLTGRF
jgi:hypothetical protein